MPHYDFRHLRYLERKRRQSSGFRKSVNRFFCFGPRRFSRKSDLEGMNICNRCKSFLRMFLEFFYRFCRWRFFAPIETNKRHRESITCKDVPNGLRFEDATWDIGTGLESRISKSPITMASIEPLGGLGLIARRWDAHRSLILPVNSTVSKPTCRDR